MPKGIYHVYIYPRCYKQYDSTDHSLVNWDHSDVNDI